MQINIEPKAETQILSAYACGVAHRGLLGRKTRPKAINN